MIKGFWEAWCLTWFVWSAGFALLAFSQGYEFWAWLQCALCLFYAVLFFIVFKNRTDKAFKEQYS